MNDKYLLAIMGSSTDLFYEYDNWPNEGEYTHCRFKGMAVGGPPLNAACACASKGVNVKALDILKTNDTKSEFIVEHLRKAGVDVDNVVYKDIPNIGEVIITVKDGQRTMFVVDAVTGPVEVDEKVQELLNNATYIYAIMDSFTVKFADISSIIEAKKHGAKFIIDGCNPYTDEKVRDIVYKLCDGIFINTQDYQRLKDISNDQDPKETLLKNGCEFVVVTDGTNGSTCYTQNAVYNCKSMLVDVVDSTGAGDSYAGTFIAGLLKGYDYPTCMKLASGCGAYACTKIGGSAGICSFDELTKFMEEHNYSWRVKNVCW